MSCHCLWSDGEGGVSRNCVCVLTNHFSPCGHTEHNQQAEELAQRGEAGLEMLLEGK